MVPDDWIKVARHAAQMLKPGGAIQWIEADFVQLCRAMLSHPAANGSSLEHWVRRFIQQAVRPSTKLVTTVDERRKAGVELVR